MQRIKAWATIRRRAYLYRVAVAVGAVAVFYGKITGDELVVWLALVGTTLATGTAALNTPTLTLER